MTCKTCKGFGYLLTVPSTCSAGGDRVACPVCTPSQRLDAKEGGFTKEWCLKMSQLEAGQEIGAGMPDHPLRRPETEGN